MKPFAIISYRECLKTEHNITDVTYEKLSSFERKDTASFAIKDGIRIERDEALKLIRQHKMAKVLSDTSGTVWEFHGSPLQKEYERKYKTKSKC